MTAGRINRRALLGTALSAATGVGAVTASSAQAAELSHRDREILEFALVLEELQAAFYTEAERAGALRGELAKLATVVGGHERDHVRTLRGALGTHHPPSPRFDFKGATETPAAFARTAVAFEDLGVAAYKGQMPRLESRPVLAVVLSIHAVEARHAAWIRRLAGVLPAATAFDRGRSEQAILSIVRATRFVVVSSSNRAPGFTG